MNKIKDIYYFSWLSLFCQWLIERTALQFYYYVLHKTKVEFIGNKPDKKINYLIVSNHRSLKDPPLLGATVRLPFAFIAKKELFDSLVLKILMWLCSTISVDRDKTDSSTFKLAKKAMQSKAAGFGWSSAIFIEGTRSKDPEFLGTPNKGAIFLAKLAKVPIIPVGISYRNGKEIIVKIGEAYEIDYKADLEDQAWQCLEKISELCDYKMPNRHCKRT